MYINGDSAAMSNMSKNYNEYISKQFGLLCENYCPFQARNTDTIMSWVSCPSWIPAEKSVGISPLSLGNKKQCRFAVVDPIVSCREKQALPGINLMESFQLNNSICL